jgi:hypothetical protein
MKKILLSLLGLCLLVLAQAQKSERFCYLEGDNCVCVTKTPSTCPCAYKHPVFNIPKGVKPRKLARLGSFPQFGNLSAYPSVDDAYKHFQQLYKENKNNNAREFDRIFVAMGYTGFTDPRFTPDKMSIVYYDGGITGMTGNGNHQYLYATISEGQNIKLKAFVIKSFNGCDISIMETCGNISYFGNCQAGTMTENRQVSAIDYKAHGFTNGKAQYTFNRNDSCFVRVCEVPEKTLREQATTLVNNLQHDQQFGSMIQLNTADEVYAHLQKLYKENKNGNAAELDRLLQSVGYTEGVKDAKFSAASINVVKYPGGVMALMGNGSHQYMNSMVSTPMHESLRGFNIKSLNDNCDLTIIDVCGNALYCPTPVNCKSIPCGCN